MKKYLLLWLLLPSFCFAQESVSQWRIIPEKTHINWTASYGGKPIMGTLPNITMDLKFDVQKPEEGNVSVTIPMDAIQSDDKNAAEMVKADEWLATAHYPTATFVSEKIIHDADKGLEDFQAQGMLTIHGISKHVTFPFTLNFTGGAKLKRAWVKGTATFNRLDFGIGTGEWANTAIVGNEIKVTFDLAADAHL